MQKGVADVHAEAQQELDDLQVLILDADEQSRAAERVDAVDVDLEVDLRLLSKHPPQTNKQTNTQTDREVDIFGSMLL